MADQTNPDPCIDPKSGFCPITKTFHSLRPSVPLPSPSQSLSLTQFVLSLLQSSAPSTTACVLIDAASGVHLSYPVFLRQIRSLSLSLKSLTSLSKGQSAFILCPPSIYVPVIYFALLSLGITISPANPIGSDSEISHQVQLSEPTIAFVTSATAHKLPSRHFSLGTIFVDSPEFLSMLSRVENDDKDYAGVQVSQSDPAAILFSSGTTGRVKGVLLTHRNLIALIAGFNALKRQSDLDEPEPHPVSLLPLPLFHVFGFFMLVRAVSMGETLVLMERFDFEGMLRAVEKYKVTYMPVSPPLIVALAKSGVAQKYDLSSLRVLGSGGAPLGKEVVERFNAKFPDVEIVQGYGLTETGGGASRTIEIEESKRHSSVGKLAENMEAKIVDPVTGQALLPGHKGELWLRGPTVMKGYVGDDKATAETLDSQGWLKTGDLCYFDSEGFLYIVDRLKELIKYKAYQVPPAELEHLLVSNRDIADAAVIPYPDEEAGQIPMAYVVRKPGSNITEAQVIDFVAKQVAPYKKIRRVSFINSIPKSPAGKILRRELPHQMNLKCSPTAATATPSAPHRGAAPWLFTESELMREMEKEEVVAMANRVKNRNEEDDIDLLRHSKQERRDKKKDKAYGVQSQIAAKKESKNPKNMKDNSSSVGFSSPNLSSKYDLVKCPVTSTPVRVREFGSSEESITEFCRECRIVLKVWRKNYIQKRREQLDVCPRKICRFLFHSIGTSTYLIKLLNIL